jgi:Family of unknown function (DUF5684)
MNDYTYTTTTTTTTGTTLASAGLLFGLVLVFLFTLLAVYIITIIAGWKIFKKAGVEGWKSIIPVYNSYVLLEISGHNGLLVFLSLIPGGSLAVLILTGLGLAKNFGKSVTFAVVALMLFAPIGYLILAFGDSKYLGGYYGGQVASTSPSTPSPEAPNVTPTTESTPPQTTPPTDVTPPQV